MGAFRYYAQTTKNGYSLNEVASALQKAIRRGLEDDAIYWATELDMSGFGNYAWKRMRVIVAEDIGIAEPNLPATIHALYSWWQEMEKTKAGLRSHRLFVIQAASTLARAKKSRFLCHASISMHNGPRDMRPIPDYAFDRHTQKGKSMGRGFDHFWKEGAHLENEDKSIKDPYFKKAVKLLEDTPKKNLFDDADDESAD